MSDLPKGDASGLQASCTYPASRSPDASRGRGRGMDVGEVGVLTRSGRVGARAPLRRPW